MKRAPRLPPNHSSAARSHLVALLCWRCVRTPEGGPCRRPGPPATAGRGDLEPRWSWPGDPGFEVRSSAFERRYTPVRPTVSHTTTRVRGVLGERVLSYPKVLVTGAAGLVGSALVAELQSFGYPVVGLTSADGDLRDPRATEALLADASPDIVVHIAARVHGLMGNIRAQGRAFLDNIRMNTNVIEAARMAGVRKVVGMGSTAVYSDDVPLPMREDTIWWGEPHGSEGGYAHAKRAMIAQLQAYQSEYGLDWAVALSTNLYGPHDRFDEAEGHVLPSLVSKFHRATRDGTDVDVWGTGTPTRDFVFSGDAARALRLIMEQATGVVNLASGASVTIRTAVETLQKVSGFSGEVMWDASKPDGQHARAYDVSRLKALGWEPQVSLEDGLRATYHWYVDNCADARR